MRGETITGTHQGVPVVPAQEDAQGNPVLAAGTTFTINHCLLAPSGGSSSGSTETAEPFGTFVVSSVQVIVLKTEPVILPTDRLTFWGEDWQVDGLVGPWRKGRLFGSVFMVKRAS